MKLPLLRLPPSARVDGKNRDRLFDKLGTAAVVLLFIWIVYGVITMADGFPR